MPEQSQMPTTYAVPKVHPVQKFLERHSIPQTVAAEAIGTTPSNFNSKLSGRVRWTTREAACLLELLRKFDARLSFETLFPLTVDRAAMSAVVRKAKAAAKVNVERALKSKRRRQREMLAG